MDCSNCSSSNGSLAPKSYSEYNLVGRRVACDGVECRQPRELSEHLGIAELEP
jgi:hypothetical protein